MRNLITVPFRVWQGQPPTCADVSLCEPSADKPRSVQYIVNWSTYGATPGANLKTDIDLRQQLGTSQSRLNDVKSCRIDNRGNGCSVVVQFFGNNWATECPAYSEIWVPVDGQIGVVTVAGLGFARSDEVTAVTFYNVTPQSVIGQASSIPASFDRVFQFSLGQNSTQALFAGLAAQGYSYFDCHSFVVLSALSNSSGPARFSFQLRRSTIEQLRFDIITDNGDIRNQIEYNASAVNLRMDFAGGITWDIKNTDVSGTTVGNLFIQLWGVLQ